MQLDVWITGGQRLVVPVEVKTRWKAGKRS
jgi:hypothetical protein